LGFIIAATRQGSLASPTPLVSHIEASAFTMMAINESSIIVGCDNRFVRAERRF